MIRCPKSGPSEPPPRRLSWAQGWAGSRVTAMSRLDVPTSGLLPVALGSEETASSKWFKAQFASRLVQKEYLCLCHGRMEVPPWQLYSRTCHCHCYRCIRRPRQLASSAWSCRCAWHLRAQARPARRWIHWAARLSPSTRAGPRTPWKARYFRWSVPGRRQEEPRSQRA